MTAVEVWIPLTQGKVTVIDFDDFEKVRPYKWYSKRFPRDVCYAAHAEWNPQTGKQRDVLLHRFLLNAASGELVDHKDRDGLNNRHSNLRTATRTQNAQNQIKPNGCASRFKGICWSAQHNKWRAGISVNGHKIFLGIFVCEETAARAYDAAAMKHFGEFARINFPKEVSNA